MAKHKKRALLRKRAPSKRVKARTRGKSSGKAAKRTTKPGARKVAKRVAVTAKAKKRKSRARAMAPATEEAARRPTAPSTRPAEARDETVIIDVIEEPFPGVVVVTEFESVRTELDTPTSTPASGKTFVAEGQDEEDQDQPSAE